MAVYKITVTVLMICGSMCAMENGRPALPAAQQTAVTQQQATLLAAQREAEAQHQAARRAAELRAQEEDYRRTTLLAIQPDPHASSVWRSADGTMHVRCTQRAVVVSCLTVVGCSAAYLAHAFA